MAHFLCACVRVCIESLIQHWLNAQVELGFIQNTESTLFEHNTWDETILGRLCLNAPHLPVSFRRNDKQQKETKVKKHKFFFLECRIESIHNLCSFQNKWRMKKKNEEEKINIGLWFRQKYVDTFLPFFSSRVDGVEMSLIFQFLAKSKQRMLDAIIHGDLGFRTPQSNFWPVRNAHWALQWLHRLVFVSNRSVRVIDSNYDECRHSRTYSPVVCYTIILTDWLTD